MNREVLHIDEASSRILQYLDMTDAVSKPKSVK